MVATLMETSLDSKLDEIKYEAVAELRKQLGQKFGADDLLYGEYRGELAEIAHEYTRTYTGSFEYMQDMALALRQYGHLTPNQAKGVLNCIVAEWNRAQARKQEKEDTLFEVQLPAKGGWVIPDGKFTLVREGEANKTYKIKTLDKDHQDRYRKPAGTRMMFFLNGPDNQSDYAFFAWVTPQGNLTPRGEYQHGTPLMNGARMLLDMDKSGALDTAKAFALWSNRCAICGAELTDADSIAAAMGPICRSKFF